jgi:hypothetical protein
MPPPRQRRPQTTIHDRDITNSPLLPRVVTPMTRNPSPPRVPTRSRNLSPRNLSQNDFCGMDTAHMSIAPAITIGPSSTNQIQSFTPSLEKKWNTWHLCRTPVYRHFGNEALATNAGACSKRFEIFLEPTHVSLSNSQTSRKTEKSLTAK